MLRPALERYALARPNARSSHEKPTAQGGGIAVIGTTLVLSLIVFAAEPAFGQAALREFAPVMVAAILLALVGMVDDIRTLAPMPRLLLQFVAVALPDEARIAPPIPFWLERALLLLAGVWFVNLVNFMDGIDWMTVAEVVPITVYLVVIGFNGGLPAYAIVVAIALCGAMLGFAPFNQPVARLFLGDVGSLPIGLLLGWLLLLVAGQGYVAAAILLPMKVRAPERTGPSIILPTLRSPCCAGCARAKRSGRRIAAISINAPLMAASPHAKSSPRSSCSISCWLRSPPPLCWHPPR